jgi:SNF2 family DNA or RNA helicase
MGTGKSLSALATIDRLKKKAMVVAPPYLVNNWLHEIRKHTTLVGSPHYLHFDKNADITVVPYTQIAKAEDVFKNVEYIIVDEGQYLKNLEAKRTKDFHELFEKYTPEYFGYLSGTPIKNRIPEIYSMLLLFSKGPNLPKITDAYRSMYVFCCRFTNVKQTNYGTKFEGMKNVEELRKYINPFSIRHGDEVLGLPSLTESNVVVSYAENSQLQAEWDKYVSEGTNIDVRAKNGAAITKATFTANYVSEAISDGLGPIVVFSDHVKPLEIMELDLSKLRVKSITGSVSSTKRQEYVDMFAKGQLDVLLCSIGAASTGFNLTASNMLVFNDPSWVSTDMEQAKKRIHRIGTTKACRIVNVVGSPTDEYIYKMLASKDKVINKVIKER